MPHLTSYHLTSPHITSHHITSPRLSISQALSEIEVLKGEAIKRNGEAEILANKVQDLQSDLSSRDSENRGLQEDIETKMSLIADFENRLLREKTEYEKDLLAIKISNSALKESRSREENNAMEGLRSRVRELESNELSRDLASEKDSKERGRVADALKSEVASLAARLEETKLRHQDEIIKLKMENSAIAEAARVEHEERLRDLRSDCDRDLSDAQEQQNSQVSKIKDDLCKEIEDLGAQNKRLVESVSLLEGRLMPESAPSEEACSAADKGADKKARSRRKKGCADPVSTPVLRSEGAIDTESEVTTHPSSQPTQGLASSDGDVVAVAGITGDGTGTRCGSKGGEVHVDDSDVTLSALQEAAAASLLREETLQEKINYMDAEVSKMRLDVSNLQTKIQLQLEELATKNDALAALEVALSSSSSASDAFRAKIAEEEQQRKEGQTRLEELLLSKDSEAEYMKGLLESEQNRAEEYQKVIENLKLASQLAASETERLKVRMNSEVAVCDSLIINSYLITAT
jgi:chromosome segregation ATPase